LRDMEQANADRSHNPADYKRRLAREIVATYHGAGAGEAAEERFDQVHKRHEVPADVPEAPVPESAVENGKVWLPRLLADLGLAQSNSDGRRMIEQGAVRIDGKIVTDATAQMAPAELAGKVVQVGKRRFVRIAPS
jgi:tyrosyl-tRNA synthetase